MHSDADTDFQHTQIHILTFNVQHLRANLKVFEEIPIVWNGVSQLQIRHKLNEKEFTAYIWRWKNRSDTFNVLAMCRIVFYFFSSFSVRFTQHQHLQIYFKLKLKIPTANKERKWCRKHKHPFACETKNLPLHYRHAYLRCM